MTPPPPPPPVPLHALGCAALAQGYAARAFTPLDVAASLLAQVRRLDGTLRALWAVDEDALQRDAAASTARHAAGRPLSPLDGVPVTVKDNLATRGQPVPLGCAASDLAPAADDAPPVARLREAGALPWAKTTMPDVGMLSSSRSSFHPLTRNPWDPARTPGGSSGGAGAAAAAGFGPLHLGTDIGGSIRLPAAWCGVVGFKPSAGRVPIAQPYPGRVAGPIARSVADCAAAMAVLARPDPQQRDPTALPPADIDWGAVADPARADAAAERHWLRGLRIGVLSEAGWGQPVAPGVAAALRDAVQRLRDAGAQLQPVAPFTRPEVAAGIDTFWRLRFTLWLQALPAPRRARVLPFIRDWAAPGAALTGTQAYAAWACLAELRDAALAALRGLDFLIGPVAPDVAAPVQQHMPVDDPAQAMAHIGFTLPANASEQPALALPAALDAASGLPVGLQIVGARHDDLGVLRLGRLWERLRAPLPALPPLAVG